ncbi:hypothetical protein BA700_07155 [Corynebacterium stationis]|nr:hypothetical protein AW169_07150 [Corynebacterium stationis]AQX71152.1 hypothetical protein CA21670_06335 [Corynebacterium stationis]ASJ18840.1 hypothetical protein BA700_07155 [Corynebacterium stationis]
MVQRAVRCRQSSDCSVFRSKTKTLLQQFQTEVAQGLAFNTRIYLPKNRVIKSTLLVTDVEVYAEEVPLLNLYQPHDSAIVYFSPVETSLRGDFLGNTELVNASLWDHIVPWAKNLAKKEGQVWPTAPSAYTIAGGSLGDYTAAGIVVLHHEIALMPLCSQLLCGGKTDNIGSWNLGKNTLMRLMESSELYSMSMEDTIFIFHRKT